MCWDVVTLLIRSVRYCPPCGRWETRFAVDGDEDCGLQQKQQRAKKAETSLQRPPVTNKSRRICCRMRQRRQWPARRPITKRQTAWLSPAPTTKNLAAILSRSSNQSAVTAEHYWPLYVLRITFFILLTCARIVRNGKQSRPTWIPVYCFVGFDHAGRLNDERNATLIMSV